MTVRPHSIFEPRQPDERTQAERIRILEGEVAELQGALYALLEAIYAVRRKLR